MSELSEKIEELRLQEVNRGNLYDCPNKLYGKKVIVDGIERCEGAKIGVCGVNVSTCCETCPAYQSR